MEQEKFKNLIEIFIQKNSQLNLSAIRDPESIYHKHILDSIAIKNFYNFDGQKVLDLGTGGGFPGLPLAMEFPTAEFILLDSTRKKVDAVKEIAEKLNLQNVKTVWSRAEDYKEKVDCIVTRSVAYVNDLFRYSAHLLNPGGKIFMYKMNEEELRVGQNNTRKYHFKYKSKYEYKILDQQRYIWEFEKVK